jgi:L-asparaginase II
MIAAPGAFDTVLMEKAGGTIVSKGGAEGYQGMAIAPGVLKPDAPGFGIAFKIADGDVTGRARPVLAIELLRQLGVLSTAAAEQLAQFDHRPIHNFRRLEVGEIRPAFSI